MGTKEEKSVTHRWKIAFEELEFLENIGKGNFGEVWKGTYLGLDVAIKRLYFVDDDFMQKYIAREMATLTGLFHPHIVQLMGLCVNSQDVYIVTEFINGGDLRGLLKDRSQPLSWGQRLGFARDIALALNYLHHKNVMHRDIKSKNLLIGDNYKVKVCDFGLARTGPNSEEERRYVTTVGTHEWMAPEVAMQQPYDKSADVFSYGMVLWELITRRKPPVRHLKDAYAFVSLSREEQEHVPRDTPEALWQLLCDCARTSPQERPTFEEIVARIKDIQVPRGEQVGSGSSLINERREGGGGGRHKRAASIDLSASGHSHKVKEALTGAASGEERASQRKSSSSSKVRLSRHYSDDDILDIHKKKEDDEEDERDENGEEDDEDEEKTTTTTKSFIYRDREVTEVTKTMRRPFSKEQWCHFKCSIQKRAAWAPGTTINVNVSINNGSGRTIRHIKAYLLTSTNIQGKKKLKMSTTGTTIYSKTIGFPLKGWKDFDDELKFKLPSFSSSSSSSSSSSTLSPAASSSNLRATHELVLEFPLKKGMYSSTAKAYLPIHFKTTQ
ncbi:putative serine/threonine-protein kinase PBL7 [Balamuthia mandrillaris]